MKASNDYAKRSRSRLSTVAETHAQKLKNLWTIFALTYTRDKVKTRLIHQLLAFFDFDKTRDIRIFCCNYLLANLKKL